MNLLGQHFLKNKSAIKKIVGALDLRAGDIAIEIGAGHGELTLELIAYSLKLLERKQKNSEDGIKIISIEKDPRLASNLELLTSRKNCEIEIKTGDALKLLPGLAYQLKAISYKIVGNIPYYLTGRLLRNISELENKPELCVLTLQKEVAQRICAVPPKMNRLAAIIQFWAEPKIIGFIPKTDFEPLPKVDSAIIQLKTRRPNTTIIPQLRYNRSKNKKNKKGLLAAENKYYKIVKILFQQPRKTVANNLVAALKMPRLEVEKKLKKLSIAPNLRPQDLNLEEIVKMSAVFQPQD
ncbi:MAG: hypothetical protein HYT13_00170 [Candidatus Liptonbacteria bacterium]|nr:hypothetical protein [Candidatus Liptonbacteria bacterium]